MIHLTNRSRPPRPYLSTLYQLQLRTDELAGEIDPTHADPALVVEVMTEIAELNEEAIAQIEEEIRRDAGRPA